MIKLLMSQGPRELKKSARTRSPKCAPKIRIFAFYCIFSLQFSKVSEGPGHHGPHTHEALVVKCCAMVQQDFPKGKNVLLIYELNISRRKMWHIPLKRGSNYLSNDMRHIFLRKISRSQFNKTFLPFGKSGCTIAQHLTYIGSKEFHFHQLQ